MAKLLKKMMLKPGVRQLLLNAPADLRPVTQIALDDTWSALRFRPQAAVGK